MLFTLFFQFLYDRWLQITGKAPADAEVATEELRKEEKPKAD
jgi:hypothetical protein